MREPLKVVYEGRTDGVRYGSWALVNARLLPALRALPDVEVQAIDPGQGSAFDVYDYDVWLSHYYPGLEPGKLFVPPDPPMPWVCWVAWEAGRPPLGWTDAWAVGRPAEVWACSAHARRLLLAGTALDPGRVRAVPYGVDPGVYFPSALPEDRWPLGDERAFRVLYVGGAVERKGCDLAVEGYCRAFTPEEPTRLVLKLQGLHSFYESAPAIGSPERADWQVLTSDQYTDPQMANLYRSVDVVCQPYRHEGFCLPLLEAMACGIPVVYPAHGPAPAYVPEGAGICLPVTRGGVDADDVARALRWLWGHPEERRAMGAVGRAGALDLAWDKRAVAVADHLRGVVRRARDPGHGDAFGPPG